MEKTEKQVIRVQDVLQHLKDGMTRTEIFAKYNLSKSEGALLFQHPKLKHKKTIKKPSFVLVDEEEEGTDSPCVAHDQATQEAEEIAEKTEPVVEETKEEEIEVKEEEVVEPVSNEEEVLEEEEDQDTW